MPRYRRFFPPFLLHRLVQVRRAIEEMAHHFVVYHRDVEPEVYFRRVGARRANLPNVV